MTQTKKENTKPISRKARPKFTTNQILTIIGIVATIVATIVAAIVAAIISPILTEHIANVKATDVSLTATALMNPGGNPILIATILPPTQPQVINPPPTLKGRLYTIEFVTETIPADGELHNVYYSIDNGAEQLLFTAGNQVNHTFNLTFSQSVRVRVAIKTGTFLYERLYVNGELVSSGNVDNNGLIYQVPPTH